MAKSKLVPPERFFHSLTDKEKWTLIDWKNGKLSTFRLATDFPRLFARFTRYHTKEQKDALYQEYTRGSYTVDTMTFARTFAPVIRQSDGVDVLRDQMLPMTDALDSDAPGVIVLEPRGVGKTVVGARFLAKEIAKNRNIKILLCAAKKDRCRSILRQIAQVLESDAVVGIFGTFRGKVGWSTEESIMVDGSPVHLPTVSMSSPDATRVGGHYDLIYCDDLVDRENINTREWRERVKEFVTDLLPMRAGAGSRMIFVGTRWHDDDVYGFLLKAREYSDFRVVSVSAHDKDGNLNFAPDTWDEPLDNIKKRICANPLLGEGFYMAQYENDPFNVALCEFKPNWWNFCRGMPDFIKESPDRVDWSLTFDAAYGRERGDNSVICWCGRVAALTFFDWRYGIWSPEEAIRNCLDQLETMRGWCNGYYPLFGVQRVDWERLWSYAFTEEAQKRGMDPPGCRPLETPPGSGPVEDKMKNRIRLLIPWVQPGNVWVRGNADLSDWADDLAQPREEFLRFPKASKDDCADAAAMHLPLQPYSEWNVEEASVGVAEERAALHFYHHKKVVEEMKAASNASAWDDEVGLF